MSNTAKRARFGVHEIQWGQLLRWQKEGGTPSFVAAKILACLESETATSEWVDQALDVRQELHAATFDYGWCTELLLRALHRDNDINPCGCQALRRFHYHYGSHDPSHSPSRFHNCPNRRKREDQLCDAARQRFYRFDTSAYSDLRERDRAAYDRLYHSEYENPAGVRAVALALLYHQRYQSCRRPNRTNGQRVVDELVAAAAKFSGSSILPNGEVDRSATPVEDFLVDRAAEVLQRMYPLARRDRRGRAGRRESLVARWMKLAGKPRVRSELPAASEDFQPLLQSNSHGLFRWPGSDRLDGFFTKKAVFLKGVIIDPSTGKPFDFLADVSMNAQDADTNPR